MKRALVALCVSTIAAALTSCSGDPNHWTLPGGTATGADGYRVTATFTNVDNLVPNSQVLYNNVAVGTVRSIDVRNWHAAATLSLEKSLKLPANVTALIGQKSLLGAEYVEIDDPPAPVGQLANSQVIPLSSTGAYPGTEQVLSAVSLLLNNGGLSQLNTITTELNHALAGHETDVRSLISRLQTFTGTLNRQKSNIISAISLTNSLAKKFVAQTATVNAGLAKIGPGVRALDQERDNIQSALGKIASFSRVATHVVHQSQTGLVDNLKQLGPVLAALQASGDSLPRSLQQLSFPFPLQTVSRTVRGDFANFFITLDLTAPSLLLSLTGSNTPAIAKAKAAGAKPSTPKKRVANSPSTAPAKAGGAQSPTEPTSGVTTPTPTTAPSTCLFAILGIC